MTRPTPLSDAIRERERSRAVDLHALAERLTLEDGTNALEYATRDGGRAPGALTGSRPSDWGPVAVLVATFDAATSGEALTRDYVDSTIGYVVNGSDDVPYSLVNGAHEYGADHADVLAFIGYGNVRRDDGCGAYYWSGMDADQSDYCRNCHNYGTHTVTESLEPEPFRATV